MSIEGPIQKTDLIPLTANQKANPLGVHLLHHYYTTSISRLTNEKKMPHPVYNLDHPKDIPLIMACAEKEGLKTYGMIILTGGRHHTPVLVHNNKVFILESLGTATSRVGINSATQIAMAVQHAPTKPDQIVTFEEARQYDAVSCGADSFMALKQAFRVADKLDTFVQGQTPQNQTLNNNAIMDTEEKADPFFNLPVTVAQAKNLPPEIAKYIQSQSVLSKHPSRTTAMAKPPEPDFPSTSETMMEYSLRHRKESSLETKLPPKDMKIDIKGYAIPDKKDEEITDKEEQSVKTPSPKKLESDSDETDMRASTPVQLKQRKSVILNAAIDQRRNKHARIVTRMIDQTSIDQLQEYVKESSGINLISKHLNDIPAELKSQSSTHSNATYGDLINTYVSEEMLKKRSGPSDVVPAPTTSLTQLAIQLSEANRISGSNTL